MVWRGNSYIFVLVAYFLPAILYSQDVQVQEVDSTWWKDKTEQLDYTEKEKSIGNRVNVDPDFEWINNPFVKYSILILIIVFILFVLYKLFGKELLSSQGFEDEKEYKLLPDEELEDRFYEMDLDSVLADSISQRKWKAAIRIQFFIVLKQLIDTHQIKWNKDLTNLQIVFQLSSKDKQRILLQLVKDFEKVWYGDHSASQQSFEQYSSASQYFLTQLKKEADDE